MPKDKDVDETFDKDELVKRICASDPMVKKYIAMTIMEELKTAKKFDEACEYLKEAKTLMKDQNAHIHIQAADMEKQKKVISDLRIKLAREKLRKVSKKEKV